jgi:4-hydroxy-4-methyl-2-oxoglutarate aldolase
MNQELGVVVRGLSRADPQTVAVLSKYGVATVHEAMGRLGLAKPVLRPIYPGARCCGPALTVLAQPGDNWMLHVAAEQIVAGDVVVVAVTTDSVDGFFGELLATSFRARGLREGHREGDARVGQRARRLRRRRGRTGRRGRRR